MLFRSTRPGKGQSCIRRKGPAAGHLDHFGDWGEVAGLLSKRVLLGLASHSLVTNGRAPGVSIFPCLKLGWLHLPVPARPGAKATLWGTAKSSARRALCRLSRSRSLFIQIGLSLAMRDRSATARCVFVRAGAPGRMALVLLRGMDLYK